MKRVNVMPIQSNTTELKEEIESTKNETKWSKLIIFRNIAKEVLLNSTSHALPNILRNENIVIKTVWTITLLISTALCSYLCIQSIMSYYSYAVNTNTRRIYESPTLFPTISICTKQKYTTDYAIEFLKKIIIKNNFEDIFNQTVYDSYKHDISYLSFYTDNLFSSANINILNENSTDEQRKMVQYKLEDILIGCIFNGIENCAADDFYWKYDNLMGNCYYLNHAKSNSSVFKYAKFNGVYFGLTMTLFMGIKYDLKILNPNRGITLFIQNSSNQLGSTQIELQAGVKTNIAIDRYFSTQFPKPYSNCDIDNDNPKEFESNLYNKIIRSKFQYDQQKCLELCYNEIAMMNCNCSDIYTLSFDSQSFCDTNNVCLFKTFQEYLSNTSSEYYVNNYCSPLCPLEFNQTSFGITLSTTDIKPDYYSSIIQNKAKSLNITNRTLTKEEIKSSIINFSIYYESLSYTLSTESPSLDIIGLLAYIGGTLGLFLGVSVLTFVEFVEIFLAFIFGV